MITIFVVGALEQALLNYDAETDPDKRRALGVRVAETLSNLLASHPDWHSTPEPIRPRRIL